MSWFDANEHCKNEGGKLVEIDSEEENTALVEKINRRGYKNMNFWIGLTDRYFVNFITNCQCFFENSIFTQGFLKIMYR